MFRNSSTQKRVIRKIKESEYLCETQFVKMEAKKNYNFIDITWFYIKNHLSFCLHFVNEQRFLTGQHYIKQLKQLTVFKVLKFLFKISKCT